MDKDSLCIFYTPPKTCFYRHAVKDKNLVNGIKKTMDVFEKNFSASQSGIIQIEIFYKNFNEHEVLVSKNSISKISDFLGLPVRQWKIQNDEYVKYFATWENDVKDIFEIIDFINLNQSETFLPISHFSIIQYHHYGTKANENAQITYTIELGKLFVQLYFILPHSTTDESIYTLISNLYRELPFKLNVKNFKLLGFKKNRYGQLKLDEKTEKLLHLIVINNIR